MHQKKLWDRAIQDEAQRRVASYNELTNLEQVVRGKNLNNSAISKFEILNTLFEDQKHINSINIYLNECTASGTCAPHPALKFNRLSEILNGSISLIEKFYNQAITGNLFIVYPIDARSPIILGGIKNSTGHIINYLGTSTPNYIQTVYLTILRVLQNAQSVEQLQLPNSLFDPKHSPNIQSTQSTEHLPLPQEWFYNFHGELLIPYLGYFFGGSRHDQIYHHKQFRAEDCSSWIAKLLNFPHNNLTTAILIKFHQNKGHEPCNQDVICRDLELFLEPIKNIEGTDLSHTIFVFSGKFSGHTGVIDQCTDGLCNTLSYSRQMPTVEGLGYMEFSMHERDFSFFKVLNDSADAYMECTNI